MTFNRISTYFSAYQQQQRFRELNGRYSLLSQQLTSNLKVQQIVEHRDNLPNVQNLRNRLNNRDRLIKGIERVETVVSTYNVALESLIKQGEDLREAATIQSSDYDKWFAQIRPHAENFLKQFTGLLNTRTYGRYIFSGVRFEEPPIVLQNNQGDDIQLYELPNFAITHALGQDDLSFDHTGPGGGFLYQASPQALPIYDVRYDPNTPAALDPDAYRSLTQYIDFGNPLRYSISSNQLPFQKIFHGARLLWSAGELQGSQNYEARTEIINAAFETIDESLEELRNLRNLNDINKYVLQQAKNHHQSDFDAITKDYAKEITIENSNLVAVELKNLDTAIQASYQLLNRRNELSLVNYLPR